MNNVLLGGDVDGGWVYYETVGGGQGGRPWPAGMSGVHTAMTNTLDTPVEAMERALPDAGAPLLAAAREWWRGSCTRVARASSASSRCSADVHGLARHRAPRRRAVGPRRRRAGCGGGELAAAGRRRGDARRLPDKCTVELAAGDVLRLLTPGGGGWGPTP